MDIKLRNFKCINEVQISIVKEKINVLYGMTGSGKSSIVEAIMTNGDISEHCIPYGKSVRDVFIEKNGFEDITIELYNQEKLNEVVFERDSDGIYSVYFDKNDNITEINAKLIEILQLPDDVKTSIDTFLEEYQVFEKDIYQIKGKGDKVTLSSKSSLSKIKTSLDDVMNRHSTFNYKGIEHLKWIQTGIKKEYQHDNYCPFCMQFMSPIANKLLGDIITMDANSINKVYNNNANMFSKLGMSIDDAIQDNKKFVEAVLKMKPIINDIHILYHNLSFNNTDISSIKELMMKPETLKTFPELKTFSVEFNKKLRTLKEKKGKIIEESQKIIRNVMKEFNKALATLTINYRFSFNKDTIDYERLQCNYKLVHKNYDDIKIDMKTNLSEGEKNLISLLLFVLQNSDKGKLLIFDDPISSTDEQRRKSILELIKQYSSNQTILILTHDQIFIKTLAFDNFNGCENYVGSLIHVSSCMNSKVTEIDYESLTSIRNHALNAINTKSEFFSKIIAVRFAAEFDKNNCMNIDKEKYSDIYTFISGLYKLQVGKIDEESYLVKINDFKYSEDDMIKIIFEEYSVDLSDLKILRKPEIKYNQLSLIDKIFYVRFNPDIEESLRKEIDSWIHLTDAQVITLNPYRFNPFTRSINSFLDSI